MEEENKTVWLRKLVPFIKYAVGAGAVGAATVYGGPAAGALAKSLMQSIFGG